QDLPPSRQRELERLQRDLGLSDDQAAQATKIYTEREEAIRKLLTDAQKERYAQSLERRGGWGGAGGWGGPGGMGGGGQGGPGGGMGRMFGGQMIEGMLDRMKTELSLTPEQESKVKGIAEEFQKKLTDSLAKAQETGDWSVMRDLRTSGEEIQKQVREILTPEQQAKFEEMNRNRWGGFGGPGGGGEAGGGGGGGGLDGRIRRIQEELKLTEDESVVLVPKIREILQAEEVRDRAVRDARRTLRTAARDAAADPAKVGDGLAAVRKAQSEGDKKLATLRGEVRELVTRQQEALLVGHGVLDPAAPSLTQESGK
ncbi:MAG: hypothetical protein L0216_03515, partial [Planctomycetales bacterium]|nr:hypothetical protein [Planctomycetales bacterium]